MTVGYPKPRPTDEDLDAIEEGIEQADAGQLIPFDRIKAWVASWNTPDERPMPVHERRSGQSL
ncbi:hypothetical protein [Azospirillum sp. sgz302134]